MKKQLFFTLIILMVFTLSVSAQNRAKITEIVGKVEVFQNNNWVSATKGMEVPVGTTVATGFNSKATIDLGDSTLVVSQLSRMKIEKLNKEDQLASTSLYLQVGKVKADVRSSAKLKHDFQFKSPVATASVRGTSFTFTPYQLEVHEGSVMYESSTGDRALAVVGQNFSTSSTQVVNDSSATYTTSSTAFTIVDNKPDAVTVYTPTSSTGADVDPNNGGRVTPIIEPKPSTNVEINVTYE